MEIVKQNETFNLTDTTAEYVVAGSVSCEASGAIGIHFTVNTHDSIRIGDCHYNKYEGHDSINFGLNTEEVHREALTQYATTLVNSVLNHFKTDI